ncbi:MAG: alkaline phosphatase D family protein [Pirellulales bacterium]
MKFAFASCQHWESGHYTAYEHMLREDLDLVLHLGDYIYEGKPAKPTKDQAPKIRYHSGNEEITELRHYRDRHAQYKTDPALAAMHAAAPWLVVWDDHEVDNNYCADIMEDTAPNKKTTKAEFLNRRAAGYQAYYEHMPLRRTSLPKGPDMILYRTASFGRLAEFQMLDTRQFRDDQPNGDGTKPHSEESLASHRTMLGPQQEKWLDGALDASTATWNVLGQQIMVGAVDRIPGEKQGYSMDQWPGSEAARRRLIKSLHEKRISNPVVLTGDIHSNWANELWLDESGKSPVKVATEFVGTSLSSGGNGAKEAKNHDATLAENPFVKFYNTERGYVNCVVTPKTWTTDYRVVEYVDKPGAPLVNRASFTVEAGKPALQAT